MTVCLPPLLCPACAVIDVPRITRGSGPHWGKAVCAQPQCGRFLKWVPKPKEVCMQLSVNRCILIGIIDRRGVEVSYHGQGTAKASLTLVVSELGSDGKEHQLFQPVEIWGKRAEQTGECAPGDVLLIEGRLKRVKQGETWTTVVSGFECQALRLPAPASAVTTTG